MSNSDNNAWGDSSAAATTTDSSSSSDAWGSGPTTSGSGSNDSWLNAAPAPSHEHFSLMDPFHKTLIPLDSWVTHAIDWVVNNFRPLFQGIRVPVDYILSAFQNLLTSLPSPIAILIFTLIAWQMTNGIMGIATLISLVLIGAIGAWGDAMVTLSLVLTSLLFCIVIGLPLGIWLARSDRAAKSSARYSMRCKPHRPSFIWCLSSCCSVSVTYQGSSSR